MNIIWLQMYGFLSSDAIEWGLTAVLVLFLIGITISYIVNTRRKKRRKKQEEQEYNERHVRTVTFTDLMMFGTIEADYDTLTGILKAENLKLPRFGSQAPNAILVENYKDADNETVLRRLNNAYDNQQDILLRMAEKMRPLLAWDAETGCPELSELAELIHVTDFQFSYYKDQLTMLIVAGAEYGTDTFSLSALYLPDPVHWEYEAVKMECSEEQWESNGETTVS